MVPLQTIGDPSGVRRQTPLAESDLGPGNTDTEASELTKNSLCDRISRRNRREKLQVQVQGQDSSWRNQQVGKEAPLAGLLVFRLQTGFSTVLSFISMLVMVTNIDLEKMEKVRLELV